MEENEERDIIVEKYKRGRDKLSAKEIDEWEDPQSEIYHVTDRYGFIHDYRLPEKLTDFENRIRAQENSRLQKWLKMLKSWEQYFPNSDKLKTRVYKGIPNAVRGEVWSRLLNINRLKQEQDGKYEEMLSYGLEHSPDVRQIDLDVNRTYRNHIMFRERYNTKQQMLFRVLVAYSVYNSEIGYCQGMSQIAALLLMYMDEEDAFWSLSMLMSDEKHAMHGFFIPGFPKLIRFARHHDDVIKKFLPKLSKLFKKYDIDSTLYTLKWFFQCFLDRVPFSLTLRLWDCFLLDGEIILTGMSYTLLKLHKRTLLRKGMESLIEFLQIELEKDFGYHDDQAINALQQSVQELRKHNMLSPREGPKPTELPSRPFGLILPHDRRNSLMNDDQSIVGSIILRPSDSVSLAQTSRTSSEVGSVSDLEMNCDDNKTLERSISIYDNVDIHESIEAAKRLSAIDVSQNRPNSRQSIQLSRTQTPELKSQPIVDQNKQMTENKETFEDSIESIETIKTLNENYSKSMIMTETKEQVIDESISHKSYLNSKTISENASNDSTDLGHNSHSIRTNSSSDPEKDFQSILNTTLPSDSLIYDKNKSYMKNELRNEFFSTSMVKTIETSFSKKIGSTSISDNSNSVLTVAENQQIIEENKETIIQFESKNESNGEIGSRGSPLRTVYKRSAEKRQTSTTSMVSPTSPVRASLIPRYIANTPLNQNSIKSQTRYESNNSSQIKNSFKNKSTNDENTKLRIFVPYSHSDRNNDNKIQLRVDSPTLQLKKSDSKCLPTVDT